MRNCALFLIALLACSAPAHAGVLTVKVADAKGKPVAGAVVTLKPVGQAAPTPRIAGPFRVEQRNMQFNPFVSIVPTGADVSFPNFDATMHHVYSFSPTKVFELKLIARNQTKSIRFDRAGIAAIGCNIHDSMLAYIFVTDTAWTARTNAQGIAVFRDAPERATTAAVWHPNLRAPGGTISRPLALTTTERSETFAVKLRPPPLHGSGAY